MGGLGGSRTSSSWVRRGGEGWDREPSLTSAPVTSGAASPGVRFGYEVAALGGVRLVTWSPPHRLETAPPPLVLPDSPGAMAAQEDGAWTDDDFVERGDSRVRVGADRSRPADRGGARAAVNS